MNYTTGCHTIFHRRYHIVGVPKYRYKVLQGKIRERIRTIILQICSELRVEIISGVLSSDNIHMFVEILLHITVSKFVQRVMQRVKGRTSRKFSRSFHYFGTLLRTPFLGMGLLLYDKLEHNG